MHGGVSYALISVFPRGRGARSWRTGRRGSRAHTRTRAACTCTRAHTRPRPPGVWTPPARLSGRSPPLARGGAHSRPSAPPPPAQLCGPRRVRADGGAAPSTRESNRRPQGLSPKRRNESESPSDLSWLEGPQNRAWEEGWREGVLLAPGAGKQGLCAGGGGTGRASPAAARGWSVLAPGPHGPWAGRVPAEGELVAGARRRPPEEQEGGRVGGNWRGPPGGPAPTSRKEAGNTR